MAIIVKGAITEDPTNSNFNNATLVYVLPTADGDLELKEAGGALIGKLPVQNTKVIQISKRPDQTITVTGKCCEIGRGGTNG